MDEKTEKKPGKTALPPKPLFRADTPAKGGRAKAAAPKAPAKAKPPRAAAPAKAKPAPKPAKADAAAKADAPVARKPRDTKADGAQTKRAVASALLTREGGTTLKEILEATGWPSISIPQLAAASNLVLRKEKVKGSPTRYFGTPA